MVVPIFVAEESTKLVFIFHGRSQLIDEQYLCSKGPNMLYIYLFIYLFIYYVYCT